jgi:hypothetical protein
MTVTAENLTSLYESWPVERLVRAAYLDFEDYNPDAVQVMRGVLESRGIASAEIDAVLTTLRANRVSDPLNRIRGWLLLFVIQVALTTAGGFINAGLVILTATSWRDGVAAVVLLAVAGYGAYCSRLLTDRSPAAPLHAQRLMLTWAAGSLTLIALWSTDASASVAGAGRPLFFAALWFPYLRTSKRVAAVYGTGVGGTSPQSHHHVQGE